MCYYYYTCFTAACIIMLWVGTYHLCITVAVQSTLSLTAFNFVLHRKLMAYITHHLKSIFWVEPVLYLCWMFPVWGSNPGSNNKRCRSNSRYKTLYATATIRAAYFASFKMSKWLYIYPFGKRKIYLATNFS